MSTSLHHHSHYLNPGSHFFFFFFLAKITPKLSKHFSLPIQSLQNRKDGRKKGGQVGGQAGRPEHVTSLHISFSHENYEIKTTGHNHKEFKWSGLYLFFPDLHLSNIHLIYYILQFPDRIINLFHCQAFPHPVLSSLNLYPTKSHSTLKLCSGSFTWVSSSLTWSLTSQVWVNQPSNMQLGKKRGVF